MMRRESCLCVLTTLLLVILSPVALANLPLRNTHLEWFVQTATVGERVRVTITKPRVKLHLAKQQRPVIRALFDDREDDYYDETPEFQVGYRRPELVNQYADVELSDEIKLRLALARMKALARHKEIWG